MPIRWLSLSITEFRPAALCVEVQIAIYKIVNTTHLGRHKHHERKGYFTHANRLFYESSHLRLLRQFPGFFRSRLFSLIYSFGSCGLSDQYNSPTLIRCSRRRTTSSLA